MDRVGRSELTIDAIECIKFVAFIVEDDELRRIEKAPRIQAVDLNTVPPVLAAIAQVNRSGCGPKRTVGRGDTPCRCGDSLAGPCRYLDYQAGLAAVFRRGRARDDLDRLHRV